MDGTDRGQQNLAQRLHEARQDAQEKQHQYRVLFETITQGIIHQADDGRIISANPAAERILALSFDQMQGRTSMDPRWQMIREDGSEVAGEDHPAMIALRSGTTVGPVIRGVFHPQKNAHVWLRITAVPLFRDGEQQPFQVYTTFDDITEEKRTAERYRSLQDYLPGIYYTFSSTRGSVYWSKQVYDILGYDPAEIQANPYLWRNSIHPEDREEAEAAMNQESRGAGHGIEYRIRARDGRWVWLYDRFIRKVVVGDELITDGFALDITLQKEAEAHLRETAELNTAIINAVPDLLFRFDCNGTYIDCFATGDELLVARELVGKNVRDVLPPDLAEQFQARLKQSVAQQEMQLLEYSLEVPAGLRQFESRFVTMDNGEILAIVRDITEQHRAQEQVQRLLHEKDTLLREVHHRIKNNTNVMMSLLSLQMETLENEAAIAALKDAASRFRSMALLYDQLYGAGLSEEGSVKEYLSLIFANVTALFPDKGVLDSSCAFEDCRCGSSQLANLGLILNELITNAMKHAFTDTPAPRLIARGWLNGDRYHITLSDNGRGIPESMQTSPSKGLGMLIVSSLIEQIAGTIRFEKDNGTRVEISFVPALQ